MNDLPCYGGVPLEPTGAMYFWRVGTNVYKVGCSFQACWGEFPPVDKCLYVAASFKPTSSGFLKLVVDFLRQGVIFSSIKSK